MNDEKLSIIIVSWNTRDILRDCLSSIYDTASDIPLEVIVIDNASSDGSTTMIKTLFPNVMLIENTANSGFAAANNQGIKIATGSFILLLNPDTMVLDDALKNSLSFAGQHPDAAVIGCKVLNPDRTLQPTCFMYPSLLNMAISAVFLNKLFPHNRFFARERMGWWQRNDVREVQVVTGCFMMVRKDAIDQVGMLDDNFFIYGEETDWCYRFRKAGWKILFTPDAQIVHLGGQSTKQVPAAMIVKLRMGILQYIRKHRGFIAHKIACLLTILFFAIRLPAWAIVRMTRTQKKESSTIRIRAYRTGINNVTKALFNGQTTKV